jgi:hypothetical protein
MENATMTDYGHEARELELWMMNDGAIYRAYLEPMYKNLERKWRKGTYDLTLGIKGMRHAVDAAAKQYHREHGTMSDKWSDIFTVSDRNRVAEVLCLRLVAELRAGNSYLGGK